MGFCIYGKELAKLPALRHGMFCDRKLQFADRLGWDVKVNSRGEEIDEYDNLNPLYLIHLDDAGMHQGSMRFLPTTGRTMITDRFPTLSAFAPSSPFIWECTRFCLTRNVQQGVAAKLLAYGALLMKQFALEGFVGVYDKRMERVYQRLHASPERIGEIHDANGNTICAGIWSYSRGQYQDLLMFSEIDENDLSFQNMLSKKCELSNVSGMMEPHVRV